MIEFRLKQEQESHSLVEVFGTAPNQLVSLSESEIRQREIFVGNQPVPLGELFSVTGDPSDLHHVWHGDLKCVGGIGYRMREGWIQIQGSAGNHTGSQMSGGTLQLTGDVGDLVGSEMTDGLIHVQGNAGSHVGASPDHGRNGQNGGAILIEGSAGSLAGKAMRRGVVAIGGDAGNCCGWLMRAGTILVFGKAKKNLGLEMIRGTIVVGNAEQKVGDGFTDGGIHPIPMLRLIDRFLTENGFSNSLFSSSPEQNYRIWHGDRLHGSRGEVLIAE